MPIATVACRQLRGTPVRVQEEAKGEARSGGRYQLWSATQIGEGVADSPKDDDPRSADRSVDGNIFVDAEGEAKQFRKWKTNAFVTPAKRN